MRRTLFTSHTTIVYRLRWLVVAGGLATALVAGVCGIASDQSARRPNSGLGAFVDTTGESSPAAPQDSKSAAPHRIELSKTSGEASPAGSEAPKAAGSPAARAPKRSSRQEIRRNLLTRFGIAKQPKAESTVNAPAAVELKSPAAEAPLSSSPEHRFQASDSSSTAPAAPAETVVATPARYVASHPAPEPAAPPTAPTRDSIAANSPPQTAPIPRRRPPAVPVDQTPAEPTSTTLRAEPLATFTPHAEVTQHVAPTVAPTDVAARRRRLTEIVRSRGGFAQPPQGRPLSQSKVDQDVTSFLEKPINDIRRERQLTSNRQRDDDPIISKEIQPVRFQQGGQDNSELPEGAPFEFVDQKGSFKVPLRRSRLLKMKFGVFRTAIVDPAICDIIQYTPNQLSVIGRRAGSTHVTFWFEDNNQEPMTYLVEITPDVKAREDIEREYELLEEILRELFPDSKVTLTPVADKLIVRGQAKDSEEAAQVMSIVRAQSAQFVPGGSLERLNQGSATRLHTSAETGGSSIPTVQIINMLMVPGVQQIALRVKIAELNRTAARGVGVNLDASIDINGNQGALLLNSMLNAATGNATSIIGSIDNGDIEIGLRWLQQQGVIRVLSEPTLVTLSGRPATFLAGGEFAVPTVVGTGGVNAVTTDFRAFGAIISFNPIVIDKDHIRLQVAPEFSQINAALSVGGTPGLNVRAVSTTVEMREGQTLAIAGLLDESMSSSISGNLPWLEKIVGKRDSSRNETELIILVTPEFMHPMDPEEVPPLPGFDVSEPTDKEFFWHGRIEGHPSRNNRSTVWPRLKRRYGAGGSAMISGPFGHGQ
ncbi:MAG: pilus assembly protein N-terminal domain-containing protein [Pirellulaceae bacterium]|nr:pilus assembly protein N-terminal domain-containing protein [Pirellulaceae bacterium]